MTYSGFVKIDASTGIISYKTNTNNDAGVYEFNITGTVSSKYHTYNYTTSWQLEVFELIIPVNIGPPQFMGLPLTLKILADDTFEFSLPPT